MTQTSIVSKPIVCAWESITAGSYPSASQQKDVLPPRGYFTTSGAILGCHNWKGEVSAAGI